ADRLQALMDRMLTPHRAPRVEPLGIHEVLERVRILVKSEYGIEICQDYDPSLPEMFGDRELLIQAVLNIARNAAQAGGKHIAFNSFSSAQEALDALSGGAPEVLVSDIRMPGLSGLELLQAVKQRHPAVPVIVMTAYSDLDSAVAAFQGGAYEYLPKPFDVDQAVELIRRALDESRRESEAIEPMGETPEILGQAPAMQDVFRAIGRLSQSSATVLITGESG